jgi:hypothetical protein
MASAAPRRAPVPNYGAATRPPALGSHEPRGPIDASERTDTFRSDSRAGPPLTISEPLIRFAGLVGWLTLLVGVVGVAVAGRGSKLGALQLSGDPEEVRAIVQDGEAGANRRMERQLVVDYAFLFCYWLTFIALAIVLARRGGFGYRVVAFVAVLAATLTALLDVLENLRTRGVLTLSRPGDQVRLQPVKHLRRTSLLKWSASAATLALLSIAFLPGESGLMLLGFAFLIIAAIGFAGLRWNRLIQLYLGLFFVLGIAIAVWFTFWSSDVVVHL